jgi:hypothetical protein
VLHTISFTAVVVVIFLTAWIALVFESGGHPPAQEPEASKPEGESGQGAAPEREAA